MRRLLGIAFGLLTQALFLATIWQLFWFLYGRGTLQRAGSVWTDGALAVQFAVLHSWLLHPAVRSRLQRWIAPAMYGCFFCLVTCASLWLVFLGWHTSRPTLWQLHGWTAAAVRAGFVACWLALIYSLNLTGLGYQTGWTPWWYWLQRRPAPPRRFEPRGAYRWLRHPVYLSFMGLLWFTPAMTLDRALLTGLWTGYLLLGSWLKDRRLEFYYGQQYRAYQSQVVGYPLIGFGPLGRRRRPETPPRRRRAA